jgi:hypothetical protein
VVPDGEPSIELGPLNLKNLSQVFIKNLYLAPEFKNRDVEERIREAFIRKFELESEAVGETLSNLLSDMTPMVANQFEKACSRLWKPTDFDEDSLGSMLEQALELDVENYISGNSGIDPLLFTSSDGKRMGKGVRYSVRTKVSELVGSGDMEKWQEDNIILQDLPAAYAGMSEVILDLARAANLNTETMSPVSKTAIRQALETTLAGVIPNIARLCIYTVNYKIILLQTNPFFFQDDSVLQMLDDIMSGQRGSMFQEALRLMKGSAKRSAAN